MKALNYYKTKLIKEWLKIFLTTSFKVIKKPLVYFYVPTKFNGHLPHAFCIFCGNVFAFTISIMIRFVQNISKSLPA